MRRAFDMIGREAQAVERKLAEQRKFVLWWDGSGFDRPGRPRKSSQTADDIVAGRDGLPDRDTIARWRAKLKAEPKYQRTLLIAHER